MTKKARKKLQKSRSPSLGGKIQVSTRIRTKLNRAFIGPGIVPRF